MGSLLQPTHLIFVLLIVLILFGPGKLPDLGEGLRRRLREFQGALGEYRGALFMAKGVDPAVGRDVGDMLQDEEAKKGREGVLFILAFLLGNTTYILFSPIFPTAARIGPDSGIGLPVLVDLGVCTLAYGILKLLVSLKDNLRK